MSALVLMRRAQSGAIKLPRLRDHVDADYLDTLLQRTRNEWSEIRNALGKLDALRAKLLGDTP